MQFELLSKHHLMQLLSFELENRAWFESLIEPRGNAFYSVQGVSAHIDSEIEKVNSGSAFCGLLIKDNEIVARANLKDIEANKAFVGYRVSKNFISQGYASFCLASLIKIANTEFNIKTLEAKVLENNPASKHILLKHGFEIIGSLPNFLTLNSKQLTCLAFRLQQT
jgi:ribosomal-protein-alanine N-acetyltransferase